MEFSRRYRIGKALKEALEKITSGNGYGYDLSQSIYLGRNRFGDNYNYPLISLQEYPVESAKPVNSGSSSQQKHSLFMIIQGIARESVAERDETQEAYYLLAEVRRRLAEELREFNNQPSSPNILGLGRFITNMSWDSGTVRPADELVENNYFYMLVEIEYVEDSKFPYLP